MSSWSFCPSILLQTGSGSVQQLSPHGQEKTPLISDQMNRIKTKKNPNCSCSGFVVFFFQLKTSCVGGRREPREKEEESKCPSHGFHFFLERSLTQPKQNSSRNQVSSSSSPFPFALLSLTALFCSLFCLGSPAKWRERGLRGRAGPGLANHHIVPSRGHHGIANTSKEDVMLPHQASPGRLV